MKKNKDRQAEEKLAPQYGFRKLRPTKIPKLAWVSLALSFVLAALMFVMYVMSLNSAKNTRKTLLIYSDGTTIPMVSMRNSLASAGFDFDVVGPDKHSSRPDFFYTLPEDYKNEEVVVCAIGKDSFKVMNDLLDSGNGKIEGYILIDPEYPGNIALEGYTSDYPGVPCAVFGFEHKAKSTTDLSGSQMIFEKISGVDTMYGHPTQRGKIFPSLVYISPNQMRYLSLTTMKVTLSGLIASPSFQSELAQYLGTTYGTGYSSAKVVLWMAGMAFALFMSIALLALFLFMVPVSLPDKEGRDLKARNSLGAIIFLGVSGWIALCGAVTTFIPQWGFVSTYIALYSPVLIVALMALAQIKLLLSNKVKYARRDYGFTIFIASIVTGILELMILAGAALNLTNIEKALKDDINPIAALIVFVIMSLSAVALIFADKKSRFSGMGPSAYFGSVMCFIEALIPPVVMLVMGLIQKNEEIVMASLSGIALGIVPFGCVIPIKRISDFYEITGLIFGIAAALIVLVA
ncbi:MAG: hypothetical protein IKE09_02685 [Clostridiales bacterium]|nr:hypothetical protein [Clostridiales bacterium]